MVEERYEIRGKIGQGGVGVVYKAYDTQLRREVAIKRVLADEDTEGNETATANLLKEATALSSVQHPHICTVYDAGIDDGGPFVVMELINGKTLDEMVERGTLTYEDFREVAIQTQEAMIAAQELNLVHRDLKPSNVMVSWLPSGRFQIKLVDFGLAKFSAKPSLQTIDHGDAVFGSIFFMAPEQFERKALDQRTDMYSLGAMFHYALTGNYPFDGDTAPQVMASHLQNSVIPLQQVRPDLPVWLCEWVMWHIQRDMDNRPESAAIALQKFLHDESVAAQGGTPQSQFPNANAAPTLQKTAMQIIQPAGNITGPMSVQPTGNSLTATAPQRIVSPNGLLSPSTAPVGIQPAHANTGIQNTVPATQNTQPHQLHINQTKKSKTLPIVIGSMVAVAVIIGGMIIYDGSSTKNHQEQYSALIKDIEPKTSITVTEEELNILLKGLVSSNIKDKQGALIALSKANAKDKLFSPTLLIANFATTPNQPLSPESKQSIFASIDRNKNKDLNAYRVVLDYALANPNSLESGKAIQIMINNADDSFVDNLLKFYNKKSTLASKNNCKKALINIIQKSNYKKQISEKIVLSYNNAYDDDYKLALLRIMGATNSKEALNILYKELDNDNTINRLAATEGLSEASTLEPFDKIIDMLSSKENASQSKQMEALTADLLVKNDSIPELNKEKRWIQLLSIAKNKAPVYSKARNLKSDWVKEFLTKVAANEQLPIGMQTNAKDLLKKLSPQ